MARKKNIDRFNLHNALDSKSYDHAVICTYTFESPFFEDYCLDRLCSLSNNGNISVLTDRSVYEKALTGPESQKPKVANIRYLLHPISVSGVFHSKLFLFLSKTKGRLIVGSANFTRPGITSNAELIGCYDYEGEKNETLKPLFRSAFEYLIKLSERWPSEQLASNLQAILREVPWLAEDEESNTPNEFALLNNLEISLWDQICAEVETPAETVYVISRYFDSYPQILDRIQSDLRPDKIKIYTQNGITNLTPNWLKHPLVRKGQAEILLCHYTDDEQHSQPLHAKGIVIEKGNSRLFAFGSANFTSAALLKTSHTGNAETLLLLREPCNKTINPARVFDPDNRAVYLKRESDLQTAVEEGVEFNIPRRVIKLYEASLNDEQLVVRAELPDSIRDTKTVLTFQYTFNSILPIYHRQDQIYMVQIPKELVHRLDESSTIIRIQGAMPDGQQVESNPLLVTNLLDIQNDKPVRRERHIKEAQQSASQFFSVLKDLLQSDDEQALLSFLNYCNIRVTCEPRPKLFSGTKPVWDGGASMRGLGERILKIHTQLHEATIDFFDRHYRRLQRHTKDLEPGGISNFLHIFLAMGGVLRAQMERLTQGLAAKGSLIEIKDWYDCRLHIDMYLDRFKLMTGLLWRDYLTPMLRLYEGSKVKEQFYPDLQPLHDLYLDMLAFRDRIENVRSTTFVQFSSSGTKKPLNYFDSILNEKKWPGYEYELRGALDKIEKAVA